MFPISDSGKGAEREPKNLSIILAMQSTYI